MLWQIPLFCLMALAHILVPYLQKKMADLGLSLKRLVWWQFFFCFALSVIWASIFGFKFETRLWMVFVIGFFNSFGAYCQWEARKINLSETSLFTQGDDIIAMSLGYWLLNETRYLSTSMIAGVALCFGAAGLLMSGQSNFRLMKFVATYSVIWGVATFLERYFAITGISFSQFLACWYGGAFLGISCIKFLFDEQRLAIRIAKKEMIGIGIIALSVWSCMLLAYSTAKLAPLTVYQPILMVSEAILPTIIGLWIFHEAQILKTKEIIFRGRIYVFPLEKFAFALGLIGVITISVSYR